MPVCSQCGRWWSPRQATTGRCDACGGAVPAAKARVTGDVETVEGAGEEARESLPWHLKLLAVSFVLYMGWRVVQGVQWLLERL